jgi:hypothetical protein
MREFLWNLALNSDGLVVGFGAGMIMAGVLVSAIAYEAGRRREAFELARLMARSGLTDPAVPQWPPELVDHLSQHVP